MDFCTFLGGFVVIVVVVWIVGVAYEAWNSNPGYSRQELQAFLDGYVPAGSVVFLVAAILFGIAYSSSVSPHSSVPWLWKALRFLFLILTGFVSVVSAPAIPLGVICLIVRDQREPA